jgi:hypothetical protein
MAKQQRQNRPDPSKEKEKDAPAKDAPKPAVDKDNEHTEGARKRGSEEFEKTYGQIWVFLIVILGVNGSMWVISRIWHIIYKGRIISPYIDSVRSWIIDLNIGRWLIAGLVLAFIADVLIFSLLYRFVIEKWVISDETPEYDITVRRWRFTRFYHTAFIASLCFVLPMSVLDAFIGWISPFMRELSWVAGFNIGLLLLGHTLPWITVNVPSVQGLISQNWLLGFYNPYVIYGPGMHCRFIWESIHRDSHFFLEDVTVLVKKLTLASRDMTLLVSFMFRWKPRLRHLDRFFQLGESTVNKQFRGMFESFFSSEIALMPGELARKGQRILSWLSKSVFDIGVDPLDEMLTDQPRLSAIWKNMQRYSDLENRHGTGKDKRVAEETRLGVNMLDVSITDMDRSADAQEARDTIAVFDAFSITAMKALGLNPERRRDRETYQAFAQAHPDLILKLQTRALAVSKDVNTNVNIFEGLENAEGLFKAGLAKFAGGKGGN